jgi:hypothetical protein
MTEKKHYHSLPSEEWEAHQRNLAYLKAEVIRLKELKEQTLTIEFKLRDTLTHSFLSPRSDFNYDKRNKIVYELNTISDPNPKVTKDIEEVLNRLYDAIVPFIENNKLRFSYYEDERCKAEDQHRKTEKLQGKLKHLEKIWERTWQDIKNLSDMPWWKRALLRIGWLDLNEEYDKIRRISDFTKEDS